MKDNIEQDLTISMSHMENPENHQIANKLKVLLGGLKKLGALDYRIERFRKCDFCHKILNEDDKFETVFLDNGNILDKCEECINNGK